MSQPNINAEQTAASIRARINELAIELEHLVSMYEDSDRQDTELRAAIRRQKGAIRELEGELTDLAIAEVA